MRINDNIPALQAYTSLLSTNRLIDKSTIRIASGFRINSGKDDAAGLAIANKLKFQISGIDQAEHNVMDGVSIVQVAEGALQETHNMLQRIRELAVQSANDTNEPADRLKMNQEVEQLINEINGIASKTEFNKMKVLFGDAARMAKIPEADRLYVDVNYVSETVPNEQLNYSVEAFGLPAVLTAQNATLTQADINVIVNKAKQDYLTNAADPLNNYNPTVVPYGIDLPLPRLYIGRDWVQLEEHDTPATLMKKFQDLLETNNLNATLLGGTSWDDYADGNSDLMISTKDAGKDQHIRVDGSDEMLALFGLTAWKVADPDDPRDYSVNGTDAKLGGTLTVGDPAGTPEPYSYVAKGNHIEITSSNGKKILMELKIKGPNANGEFLTLMGKAIDDGGGGANYALKGDPPAGYGEDGAFAQAGGAMKLVEIQNFGMFHLQIGANKGQELRMQIPAMTAGALRIEYLHVKSWEGAQRGIEAADAAIQYVSEARGRLGAYQNRLESTRSSLAITGENTSAALSRILDTDVAYEISILTKNNVIMQAGMSMLAQANQRPQQVLQLLS